MLGGKSALRESGEAQQPHHVALNVVLMAVSFDLGKGADRHGEPADQP